MLFTFHKKRFAYLVFLLCPYMPLQAESADPKEKKEEPATNKKTKTIIVGSLILISGMVLTTKLFQKKPVIIPKSQSGKYGRSKKIVMQATSDLKLYQEIHEFYTENQQDLDFFFNEMAIFNSSQIGIVLETFHDIEVYYTHRNAIANIVAESKNKSTAYNELRKLSLPIKGVLNLLEHEGYEMIKKIGSAFIEMIFDTFKAEVQFHKKNNSLGIFFSFCIF